ncbi:hypothetical protein A1O1_00645 [Capronia coronata CBS 617.96]|uniref:DUF7580 domain-containing protein n=1 Tax=Capronia coronata CBS 617.96 TaxID=1182541 RepID=W9YSL2_9EURO|nr:uncharacterized protein A1O1_00645 [Capronia coronata CBS 617.96]EXJ95523.1 hypothetical protein A1O1_00645 [Capronia coronata CBS 617.96]
MFQRRGTYLQRLSKLYSDTKQSYESAKANNANVTDLPEVRDLRRDFQIQQDRLLAWGMHWTDVGAPYSGQGDVDIDKKIDQAGLGEVVASVMSEIKRLLEESGRLEHPERYEMKQAAKSMRGPGSSPVAPRKDWTTYEVKTARALLDQLTSCIDLLYSLEESRMADEKGDTKRMKHAHDSSDRTEYGHLSDHPLHIDFASLEFSSYSHQAADPPPYDPGEGSVPSRSERSIAYYRTAGQHVLVDHLSADFPLYVVGSADDVFEVHELGEKLCKNRSLSWCGHLRLLGFTVDPNGPRYAMVYALPDGHDHSSLQQHRTLGSLIAASNNQEASQPALEDRFRLAYNLALSVMGYFSHGETHQYVNSSNILLIGSSENMHRSNLPKELRSPYLLQSCQDFLSRSQAEEPFAAQIYRHPNHDIHASEIVPAYDIYSLGLLLLEIGLWIPLSKLWKPKYDRKIFMNRVQQIYSHKLAPKCGTKYMRLVQKCLQAPAELQFRNNYEDAGAFMLQVVKDLQQCCALDEEGPPPVSDIEVFELLIIEQMCKAEEKAAGNSQMALPEDVAIKPELPKRANSKRKADAIQQQRNRTVEAPLRKWPEVDIPQEDLDRWNTLVMPKLGKILETALKDSPESCSLSLMMFGPTPENAKTTICVQCAQINKVRDVLRKRFRPKKGWGVVILNGEVRRSGKKRKPRRSGYSSTSKSRRAVARKPREQKYQERPSSGASIGAFKDSEHLPPVSFGGTILVDGEAFGMTVHHMLDVPSDDEEGECEVIGQEQPRRSAAPRSMPGQFDAAADVRFMQSSDGDLSSASRLSDFEISDDEFDGSGSDDDGSDASTIRPDYAIMDADGNEFWFLEDSPPELDEDGGSSSSDDDDASSSSSDDVDDAASIGDRIGVAPFSDDDFTVTQPAIDDVDDDFFPTEEDRDDDHLASHTFGYVFASSGIRRVIRGDMKHEVDWALIRVNRDRLRTENEILGDGCVMSKPSNPQSQSPSPQGHSSAPILTTVTPLSKLSGLQVHCRGRSSGFKKGRISQAMALVKMHGRQSFSTSWCVEGGFGIPGDSGAWVYDPLTGGLCGHVLAWGDKSKTAYIAPMEVLFEDIRGRLGARTVELPVPGLQGEVCRDGTNKKGQQDQARGLAPGVVDGDVAAKLRNLKIDKTVDDPCENGAGAGAAVTNTNTNTNTNTSTTNGSTVKVSNSTSNTMKRKGVVGVRQLVMAGGVS